MKVATTACTAVQSIFTSTLAACLLLGLMPMTAHSQTLESPFFSQVDRGQITISRVDLPFQSWNQSVGAAHREDEYQLSCGAVLSPEPYQGYYFRAPKHQKNLSKTQAATFNVSYEGSGWAGTDGDSAMTAFGRAVQTWSLIVSSPTTINVVARFDSLAPGVIGSAGGCDLYCLGPFPLPQADNTLIMNGALTESFLGDQNGAACDISATFSNQFPNYHFGEGPPPPGTIDFESIVLHELGHGLDFAGLSTVVFDTTWANPPTNTIIASVDSSGILFRNVCGGNYLGVDAYNLHTEDGNVPPSAAAKGFGSDLLAPIGVSLIDTAAYPEGSAALAAAMMGQEGGVFWADSLFAGGSTFATAAFLANGAIRPQLYAPAPWNQGSSFSHLDEATFNGTINKLMTPGIGPAEMARSPGPVACAMLNDAGWTIEAGNCNGIALPVELVAFDATISNGVEVLTWETATEDDNAGFEIQHRKGDVEAWTAVGYVEGAGRSTDRLSYEFEITSLDFGRHYFRLKQIDFDGTFAYSYEIEAIKAVPGQFVLSEAYPNPFNPTTNLNLVVGRDQEVTVELYDVSGRKVSSILQEEIRENEQRVIQIDASSLPSGIYFARVSGDNFVTNRRIILLK